MASYGPWLASAFSTWLSGKTVKALLVDASFAQEVDHQYRSSITNEVTGTGYTAGGIVAPGVSVEYDAVSNQLKIHCGDLDYGDVDLASVSGVVFYVDTGAAATDVLIAADTFAPVEVTGSTNLTYRPSLDGIVVGTL